MFYIVIAGLTCTVTANAQRNKKDARKSILKIPLKCLPSFELQKEVIYIYTNSSVPKRKMLLRLFLMFQC